MQVRARPKPKTTLNSQSVHPLLTVLLLAAPVVFIFLFSVFFVGNDLSKIPLDTQVNKTTTTTHQSTSISMTMSTKEGNPDVTPPTILYEKVKKDSTKDVYRYAAFVDGNGSKTPLSIRKWAELLADNDTKYARGLATDLSSILKARFVIQIVDVSLVGKSMWYSHLLFHSNLMFKLSFLSNLVVCRRSPLPPFGLKPKVVTAPTCMRNNSNSPWSRIPSFRRLPLLLMLLPSPNISEWIPLQQFPLPTWEGMLN